MFQIFKMRDPYKMTKNDISYSTLQKGPKINEKISFMLLK